MNKKLLTAAIAGALVAPTAANAVKYSLSGTVNRAMVFQDDGENSKIQSVDNGTSSTKFRFRGSEDIGNGMTIGMYWEWNDVSNSSGEVAPHNSFGQNPHESDTSVRQANVWFSAPFGKVSVGQIDGAGNATTEADLTSLWVSGAYAARTSFTSGMAWRTSNGADSGLTSGNTTSNIDAYGRYDGVRYDTPSFGGAKFSLSYGNDVMEGAFRYNGSVGYGNISSGVFYGKRTSGSDDPTDPQDDYRYGGSVSYSMPFGLNISGQYSHGDGKNGFGDADSWYTRVAYEWGNNVAGIGYGEGDDFIGGLENTGINVGFVHKLPRANSEVYASYTFEELDGAGVSFEDHHVVAVGARVNFN